MGEEGASAGRGVKRSGKQSGGIAQVDGRMLFIQDPFLSYTALSNLAVVGGLQEERVAVVNDMKGTLQNARMRKQEES